MATYVPQHVHFVGSIALDGPRQVFATAGRLLGRRLKRIPDGEPGARIGWVQFQWPVFRNHGAFAEDHSVDPRVKPVGLCSLRIADGVSAKDIRFGELGYAREARASYLDFTTAKQSGDLPPSVKFQVSLPTPRAIVSSLLSSSAAPTVLPIYEQAMFREVADICASIPHHELSIQWDVCIEMMTWDRGPGWLDRSEPSTAEIENANREIIDSLCAACAAVPGDVELGIHLCYGDLDGKHFVDPVDAGKMVSLANTIIEAARPINFLHLPIPLSARSEEFFRPLSALRLPSTADLYLGVVQQADGVSGAQKRIEMASRYISGFGIATECGIARTRTPQIVADLIKTHAAVTQEPAAPG
jgi:hypothetical protein